VTFFEKAKFGKIKSSIDTLHMGNVDYDPCNGMTLHYLGCIADRKIPFKNSELGFKHFICESVVKFSVHVTRKPKI